MKCENFRRRPRAIIDRDAAEWHLRVIGHQAFCPACDWEGEVRSYPALRKDGAIAYYDDEKARKAAVLDRTRHLGRLKSQRRPSPRDMQRLRLYKAEDVALDKGATGAIIGDGSVAACQAWLEANVLNQRWFIERWGKRRVPIIPGSGGNALYGGRIMLAKNGRKPYYILHELAHVLASPPDLPAHGRDYAGVYAFLVERALGIPAARALRSSFNEHNVKHRGSKLIPAIREVA